MIATITFTRRPLHVKLLRPFMVKMLRDWIADEERYLEQLRKGGVCTPEELAQREANIGPLRVRLVLWERS